MRSSAIIFLTLVACLAIFIPSAFAKVQRGSIITDNDWVFVSKFCFDTDGAGNLSWTGWSDNDANLVLLFYDDVPDSWPYVYGNKDNLDCATKASLAKGNSSVMTNTPSLETFIDHIRPHYWFVAISNCGGSGKLNFEYDFEFLNGGGSWSQQFSYDEQGLPQMYLFFWLVFTIGVAVHLRGVWVLHRAAQFHPIVRLLSSSIILETISIFFYFIHYVVYKDNGIGAPGLKGFAEILNMAAQLIFMLLLILLAKGWAITKNQVTDKKFLVILISVFLVAYLTMFIWENVGIDPASTIYAYESAPGIIILVLRVLALLWFLWSLRQSHLEESHPTKRQFYFIFGISYTVWFLILPFIVILAVAFPAWYRFKVVTGLVLSVDTLALFGLAFLLWPSRASEYFQITKTDLLLGSTSSPYERL